MKRESSIDSKFTSGGAFLQCEFCKKALFRKEFEDNLFVCTICGHHHRLSARQRIKITFDTDSFKELDLDLRSINPLDFPDYSQKHEISKRKTYLEDSIVSGLANLDGSPVSIAITDFFFMGGSMGSVAGEKITRTFERAVEKNIPAILFCASGGARMQEGMLSLMQMAKTTGAVQKCNEAGIPYIAVFTDPTMAGVLASYASLADIIIAEPKALIGFAGARVSKQAQVVKAPDDFQTSEFSLKTGMIDKIIVRRELRTNLSLLIKILQGGSQ